jgi:hypothetical protein
MGILVESLGALGWSVSTNSLDPNQGPGRPPSMKEMIAFLERDSAKVQTAVTALTAVTAFRAECWKAAVGCVYLAEEGGHGGIREYYGSEGTFWDVTGRVILKYVLKQDEDSADEDGLLLPGSGSGSGSGSLLAPAGDSVVAERRESNSHQAGARTAPAPAEGPRRGAQGEFFGGNQIKITSASGLQANNQRYTPFAGAGKVAAAAVAAPSAVNDDEPEREPESSFFVDQPCDSEDDLYAEESAPEPEPEAPEQEHPLAVFEVRCKACSALICGAHELQQSGNSPWPQRLLMDRQAPDNEWLFMPASGGAATLRSAPHPDPAKRLHPDPEKRMGKAICVICGGDCGNTNIEQQPPTALLAMAKKPKVIFMNRSTGDDVSGKEIRDIFDAQT